MVDALWSDPTSHDREVGVLPNRKRDSSEQCSIFTYDAETVETFCRDNRIELIIRAHECVNGEFRFVS